MGVLANMPPDVHTLLSRAFGASLVFAPDHAAAAAAMRQLNHSHYHHVPAYVVPDGLDYAAWVSVAVKTQASYHRGRREYQTGIDVPIFTQYQAAVVATGRPAYLYFWLEQPISADEEGGLFGGDIADLVDCEDHRDAFTDATGRRKPMMYWNFCDIPRIARIERARIARIANSA